MANSPVIDISAVSKRYCRNLKTSLWYGVQDAAKELTGRGQEAHDLRRGEFWALDDVSFAVHAGECVGLIGHNGAGKTTLLKLIHGLIKPTAGAITVRGSVRALIALDTGFNPVLTGRENIQVAGALLGFGEKLTTARVDEIIAFSELEEFIDAPVQSYSSGMLARLGFAVSVHTWPDILLVDEVLAVGDLGFAMKCFQKIAEFRSQGGAIILVSHNPLMIRTNCDRVVWLERGRVHEIGETAEVCDEFELAMDRKARGPTVPHHGDGSIRVVDVDSPRSLTSGERFVIRITLEATRSLTEPIVYASFTASNGSQVAVNYSLAEEAGVAISEGRTIITLAYPQLPFRPGTYSFDIAISERLKTNFVLSALNCATVEIRRNRQDAPGGLLSLEPEWQITPAGAVPPQHMQAR